MSQCATECDFTSHIDSEYRPISEVMSHHVSLRTGGQPCVCFDMAVKGMGMRGFLSRYFESLKQEECRKRYAAKLNDINGQDPYEIPWSEWLDDFDSWPNVTYIHVGMYLLFSGSPYTKDQLMNYKSLDCYQNVPNRWVQEVYSKKFGKNRLLIGKVRLINCLQTFLKILPHHLKIMCVGFSLCAHYNNNNK